MAEGPFFAIAYPLAHIGGGPMPGGPGMVDPGYGQGHPQPPHVGGGPVYPGYPTPGPTPTPQPPAGEVTPPIHFPPGIWPPQPGAPPTVGGGPVVPPGLWPPPTVPPGDFLIMVFVPGVGLRWVVVDKDLAPTQPLPEPPTQVQPPIAPTPEPK